MDYKNPRYNVFGGIDLELNHPDHGWIPFTSTPDDEGGEGQKLLFQEIVAKEPGHVAPYEGPPLEEILLDEWRQSMRVSAFQAKAMFLQAGYWEHLSELLAHADPITKMAWETVKEFERLSPTILEIAEVLGINDTELDDLFKFAATIKA